MLVTKQQSYYISATVCTQFENKKIFISADNLKKAFEIENELLNQKTLKIMNIRHTKYKPRLNTTHKNYIEIKSIDDL